MSYSHSYHTGLYQSSMMYFFCKKYLFTNYFYRGSFIAFWRGSNYVSVTELTFTCSKSTLKTPEKCVKYVQSNKITKTLQRRLWHRSGVFIVNFEHYSHLFLLFLLLTLNKQMLAGDMCLFTGLHQLIPAWLIWNASFSYIKSKNTKFC